MEWRVYWFEEQERKRCRRIRGREGLLARGACRGLTLFINKLRKGSILLILKPLNVSIFYIK